MNIGKYCGPILIIAGIICLLLSIGCAVLFGVYCWPNFIKDKNNSTTQTTLHIPSSSIVEVNLSKYDIDTIKKHQLQITCAENNQTEDDCEGSLEVAISHDVDWKNIPFFHVKHKTIRYWPSAPAGTFRPLEHGFLVWSWGNFTHPPQHTCSSRNKITSYDFNSTSSKISVNQVYQHKNNKDELVMVLFCSHNTHQPIMGEIDIVEYLPAPKTKLYKPIYCDDQDQNSAMVNFDIIASEWHHRSKLYVNSVHDRLNKHDATELLTQAIELQALPNAEIWHITVGGMCATLLLAVILIAIGATIICWRRFKGRQH